jgi:S-DNA-T family DNA segregation ATPase FtsK/SpoIIIE
MALSKKKNPTSKETIRQRTIILGSFLVLISLILFVSFTSYLLTWEVDQSTLTSFQDRDVQTENILSKIGAWLGHLFIFNLFGISSYIFSYLFFITGSILFFDISRKSLIIKWSWGLNYILFGSLFLSFFHDEFPVIDGVVGYELSNLITDYTGFLGFSSIIFFYFLCIIVFHWNFTPEKIYQYFKKPDTKANEDLDIDENDLIQSEASNLNIEKSNFSNSKIKELDEKFEEKLKDNNKVVGNSNDDNELKMEIEDTHQDSEDKLSEKLVEKHGEFDPTLELSKFKIPSIDLLKDYPNTGITINQEELEENKIKIVNTLKNYKIGIAQIKATIGPTVTLYEIVPEAGIRISKIKNLEDDIALSLSALGIRIIAPIPGKGTIGIEVPNQNPSIVSMKSVISSTKFQKAEMELPIALGKTISNETFVVDLSKMPHLLMAGATGQGKSVGLNAVLTSLLYKKHPAEVKFVLVDPKKVELTIYNKIERHYLAKLPDSKDPIITDNSKVINTLNSLCIEMDNRYELLKNALCRNLVEYNKKFKNRKLNPNDGFKYLPYIVLVVDEFADLIMTAGKEVETPIARLAQLARAVGIHLIIATQRPSVNVITGIIKANFPARIAFRVTSKIDSRTILDSGGADQLIGRGDMLYTQGNELSRIQCAFVDTPEVDRIADYIGSQTGFSDAYILPEYISEENNTLLDIDASDRDALFRDAAEVIVIAQQGSASLLQRKLKLGYNRAGRIIDQMEAAGIVGPFEGSKARQVLVSDLNHLNNHLDNEKI